MIETGESIDENEKFRPLPMATAVESAGQPSDPTSVFVMVESDIEDDIETNNRIDTQGQTQDNLKTSQPAIELTSIEKRHAVGTVLMMSAVVMFCLSGGFQIAAIVLGVQGSDCNNQSDFGLNVSEWLLGMGIAGLVMTGLVFSTGFLVYFNCVEILKINALLMFAGSIFFLVWFVLGAIVILKWNYGCIGHGGALVSYAVFMWSCALLSICIQCLKGKSEGSKSGAHRSLDDIVPVHV